MKMFCKFNTIARVVENYGAKIDTQLEKTSNWTISRKIIFLLTFSYPFKNRTILQKWRKIMDFRYNRTIRGGKILSSTITQQLYQDINFSTTHKTTIARSPQNSVYFRVN